MTATVTNDIWVFIDLRSRRHLDDALNVLHLGRTLADTAGGRAVACLLSPPGGVTLAGADTGVCETVPTAENDCLAVGAQQVLVLENAAFAAPWPDLFTPPLVAAICDAAPRLVMFALSDFGRELAARAAARCRTGLIADCKDIRIDNAGRVIGSCPAWGGSILSEITFADGWGTGFATVQPHCCKAGGIDAPANDVVRRTAAVPTAPALVQMADSRPVAESRRRLENADVVVVGGAGLGSAKDFGRVRQLAAALGGEVGATRPPVLNHWVDGERMIGQTGKTIAPRLLICVGASGAAQFTAGIMDADTIVVINRDPDAPMFQLADIGIVADANEFLPLLTEKAQRAVMRQLADALCEAPVDRPGSDAFGARLRKLRQARNWDFEDLAGATGQTPDFIQQVETDDISPPVGFLLRLARAFDVDPGTFLKSEEKVAIRDRRLEAYVRRTQNYSYETLTEGAGTDHLRAFMVTIEPHHAHKPVAYKHEGEEFIFVMTGELELTLDNTPHVLKSGEHKHFNSYIPHKLKSLSAESTRCLVVLYTV